MTNSAEDINKPEKIYGTIINIGGGLLFSSPKVFHLDYELNTYFYLGDYEITGPGYHKHSRNYVTFASTDKHEVETFVLGAKTICEMMNRWSNTK